ncbi:beta-N-acetylhexosaminidase [Solitalea longa]|uniref:beta-N-acetylhexosaminidase n=1 Tax=Solitalea longa TaxID=2079460 RepID=A0A2S5A6V9_9SPHI|nr:family 20 glycosylhydrolase [Solitalea longa]POY37843.1 beta-N-acetylhexosaminidase [Solitalea longa]
MIKKSFPFLLVLFTIMNFTWAQTKHFDVNNLSLKLTLIENDQPRRSSKFELSFTNKGQESFPANGWTLYFNGNISKMEAPELTASLVNGDFHKIIPTDKFKTIEAGATQKIILSTNREMDNFSEALSGFYLVWDNAPKQGFNIKDFEFISTVDNSVKELAISNVAFKDNQLIKDIAAEKLNKIFPTPLSYNETKGSFTINGSTTIFSSKVFENEAILFSNDLNSILGKKLKIDTEGKGKGIILDSDPGLAKEAYKLLVTNETIKVTASSPAGIFYGLQSLKSLIDPDYWSHPSTEIIIKGVDVSDEPRFGFRGFMMDVARNFQQKQEVLKLIDAMALYKFNTLHFHFSDDEGWRIEIPALPELTEVGSKRGHTLDDKKNIVPSYGSGADVNNTSGSGYYTKADFIEILKYADAHHIAVIPEIETPGHARAAIKSMDARYERLMKEGKKAEAEEFLLRDLNDESVYRSVQHWNDNVMNVALPSTYKFLQTVVDELAKMYNEAGVPLKSVHFGGDEVPRGVWTKSPAVQRLMEKNENIKSTDDLWYYYFEKVNDLLKSRQLYLSGWEEIGMRKIRNEGGVRYIANTEFANENFHTDVWNNVAGTGNEDLAYRLANAGYKVVLTCVTNFYLDLAYNKSFKEIGQNWGGYLDINKPFDFIPFDYMKNMKEDDRGEPLNKEIIKGKTPLTEIGKQNIVGIQAPLWSEMIKSPQRFEYLLFPKLLAVAERAWAKDPDWANEPSPEKASELYQQAWSEFVNIIGKRELPRLNKYAGGFEYRIPTAGTSVINGKIEANVQIPGLIIRYTIDGTEPTQQSKIYTEPVPYKKTVIFKVFNSEGRSGNSIKISRP